MIDGGAFLRRLFPLTRKNPLMFWNRIKSAILAVLIGLASLSPAFALSIDPNKIIPSRAGNAQQVYYSRATINFGDSNISTGVWYFTLPKNSYVAWIDAYVSTAFNAGTTNVITLGATTTANEILASGITAGTPGIYHLTSAAGLGLAVTSNVTYQTAINGNVPVYAKYTQTGTAATAGSVTVVIAYIPNDDQ